jgi:sugar lactone lactonase YvrE
MNLKAFRISLILFISLFMTAVSSGQEIKTIEGVKTIINKGKGTWGGKPEVKIELVRTIGDLFSESEELMFYLPSDIEKDREGNLYILDSGNYMVKKFSPDGEFLLSFGNEGQGPGELNHPVSLNFNNDGNVVVADQGNNRLEVFSTEGKNLTSYRLGDARTGIFKFNSSSDIVMTASGIGGSMIIIEGGKEEEKTNPLFRIYTKAGEIKKEIGEQIDIGDSISNTMVNNLVFCLDDEDNIYLTFSGLNRIEKYARDGEIQFRLERELNYDVKEPEKADVEISGNNISISTPEMTFVSNGISVDKKGRIWVCTANRQIREDESISKRTSVWGESSIHSTKIEGNTDLTKTDMYDLEIFNPEGILLGKIRLDHFADGIKIIGDRLYILDQNRGMQFYEYRIIG